jgi:hypothetical protein
MHSFIRPAPDVAQEDDAVQLQLVDGVVQLGEGGVGRVHRYRGERLEAPGMARDQLGIGIVHRPRHRGLAALVHEEDVRRRQRHDLDVDPDAVHFLQPLRGIAHRRCDAEEAGAPVLDDRASRGIVVEGEIATALADELEVRGRVVMRVQVELHRPRRQCRSANARYCFQS